MKVRHIIEFDINEENYTVSVRLLPYDSEEKKAMCNKEVDGRVYEIFNYYLTKSGKNGKFKLTTQRINKIKKRLEEFEIDQIKMAIDHALEDDFYSGHNDRQWVADLDYITRSYEITERLFNLKPRRNGGHVSINKPPEGKYTKYV